MKMVKKILQGQRRRGPYPGEEAIYRKAVGFLRERAILARYPGLGGRLGYRTTSARFVDDLLETDVIEEDLRPKGPSHDDDYDD